MLYAGKRKINIGGGNSGGGGGGSSDIILYEPTIVAATFDTLLKEDFIRASGAITLATADSLLMDSVTDGQIRLRRSGGGNNPVQTLYYIRKLLNETVKGDPQFAEMKFISTSAHTTRSGPAVLCSGDGDTVIDGYAVVNVGSGTDTMRLLQFKEEDQDAVLESITGWAVNDLVRLEVDPGSSTNTLRVYRNGSLVVTHNDSSVDRAPSGRGWPAIYLANIQGDGANVVWSELSFGAL